MLNPYATFLGDRDAMTVLAATPARLTELIALPSSNSAPGKWGVREILCHFADSETALAFRMRAAIAQEHHVIQPYDQNAWAESYSAYTAREALSTFTALRAWNLRFLQWLPCEMQDKLVTHPERGTMPFHVLVESLAGHDLNHLRQIEALVQSASAVA